MEFSPTQLAVYTLLVFLAGTALPLLILRGALPEREDSCVLTFMLGMILFVAVTALLFLLIPNR